MRKQTLLLLVIVFFTSVAPSISNAALISYSDRPTWEAALAATVTDEDFTSATVDISFGGTSATHGDLGFASNKTPATDAQIDASADALILRGFFPTHYAEVTLPPTYAFGFDYLEGDAGGDPLGVSVGGSTIATLPNQLGNGPAFFGVIEDTGATIPSYRYLSFDNGMFAWINVISWVLIPEPSAMALAMVAAAALATHRRRSR